MKMSGRAMLVVVVVLGLLTGGAVLVHLHHAPHGHTLPGHGGRAALDVSDATQRAHAGVAVIGRRWDAGAFAETVALYTAVHRELEWPGVLEPETFRYGGDAAQTFDLFLPEQGFSEPGPVFLFLHGNGLGNNDRVVPGSDGLIYSHLGKLAATFGGIGLSMSYRIGADATLAAGAEDLRLVLEWIQAHIADYGGDPGTVVVMANSEGATRAATYLFDRSLQLPTGPGVAAAILISGLFGNAAPRLATLVESYAGERVPLALWSAELDPPTVTAGTMGLYEQLCGKYDACPWLEPPVAGHNHVSHIMSLGTDDIVVQNALMRFYHTVR